MSAIAGTSQKAAAQGRAALVGYLPAGFPSVAEGQSRLGCPFHAQR